MGSFDIIDLGTLPGVTNSEASGISPSGGQVVGSSDSSNPNPGVHAVVWTATG